MPKAKKRWSQGKALKSDPAIGDLVIARLPRSGIRAVCRIQEISLSEEGDPLYTVITEGAHSGAPDLPRAEIEPYRRGPFWPMRVRAGQAAMVPKAPKGRERVIVTGFYMIGTDAYAAISPSKPGQILNGKGQVLKDIAPAPDRPKAKTPGTKRAKAGGRKK